MRAEGDRIAAFLRKQRTAGFTLRPFVWEKREDLKE
jgi:hypothetical protein